MTFKHPHRYGLMAMIARDDYTKFEKFRKQLKPYVSFFMEKNFVEDIAPQHVSLCYFSYPDIYPEEKISKLVPKINKILDNELPLRIKVQGLSSWKELDVGYPIIFWNITDLGKIPSLRNKIIKALSNDIKHFKDPEMDFTPHIGVAAAKVEFEKDINKIISKSKKMPEMELIIDRIMIFYPNGPKEIFPCK